MQEFELDVEGQRRLAAYFERIGSVLGRKERKASYAVYAMGLLGDGNRKSMEPIAARACPDRDQVDAQHQRLQHFITDSTWNDCAVRKESVEYALSAMTKEESVTHWIIDDTGFLKKGNHSVGTKRQYTGSAGKITNCQIGVSLSVATSTDHLPIDAELYLPKDWTEDIQRRQEARMPDDVVFQTKPELALQMIRRAIKNGVPHGIVLADTAYGNSSKFRRALRRENLQYAVAIQSTTKVWPTDKYENRCGQKLTVAELAQQLVKERRFRRTTWREGSKDKLSARFAMHRVLPIANDGSKRSEREVVWLLMEWENGESTPNKFYLATLPKNITCKKLVYHVKERWRTERVYQDMKEELGLDHFEGRRYAGWHHHVSVVLSCYAFIVAERSRHFSPSAQGPRQTHQDPLAA